jgi:hypothetical protein
VSVVAADQVTASATVMSPDWLPADPAEPVVMVTLAPASAASRVATPMTLSLPVAFSPDEWDAVPFEMVMS